MIITNINTYGTKVGDLMEVENKAIIAANDKIRSDILKLRFKIEEDSKCRFIKSVVCYWAINM